MRVSNLYIAQIKRKCGIEVGENFNLPKSKDTRKPQCPKEKEDAIVEALEFLKDLEEGLIGMYFTKYVYKNGGYWE